MEINRRQFVCTASAFLAIFGRNAFAGSRRLRFGVLSDVHVSVNDAGRPSAMLSRLEMALRLFRDLHVDAVVLAGDMTERGVHAEMDEVARAWQTVFPDDKGADGRRVERLFTSGNHEWEGWIYGHRGDKKIEAKYRPHAMTDHPAEFWERHWHEKYAPVFEKTVNGYTFVLAHYGCEKQLARYLKAHPPPKDRPFFYVQHRHPKGTVCWSDSEGDGGATTATLARFPNVVVFSGHKHEPANDPRSVWQDSFTSIGTSAVSQLYLQTGRENYRLARGDPRQQEMSRRPTLDGGCIILADVYDDRMTLEYRSVVSDFRERICEDRVIVFPACTDVSSSPYRFEPRRARAEPPQFAPDAQARIVRLDDGRLSVAFPPARRAYDDGGLKDYLVVAERKCVDGTFAPVAERMVYARWFYLPERTARTMVDQSGQAEECCVFAHALFKDGGIFRFRVAPRDSWDKCGNPVFSSLLEVKKEGSETA